MRGFQNVGDIWRKEWNDDERMRSMLDGYTVGEGSQRGEGMNGDGLVNQGAWSTSFLFVCAAFFDFVSF